MIKTHKITVSGRRKTAIAKATIESGTGLIRINRRPLSSFDMLKRLAFEEPLRITQSVLGSPLGFDISISVNGGGVESQVDATRLAIARAISKFVKNADLRKAFLQYDRNLLVADVRRKEQYKPNDSKARAKRQKSYR